jgi:hypothetical protein
VSYRSSDAKGLRTAVREMDRRAGERDLIRSPVTSAARVSAVSLGMIVALFPQPTLRGRAIGAFSFVGAAGA